ncbi:MAG: hypothetical protein C0394_00640 [Syntrophus sp. (in: bacteria)]|nr:hypothetical protein [Syntrophus sp. (in: bacteria)]
MKKLSKQQIIILVVMALVVIYGAYDFLAPKSKKTSAENAVVKSAELNSFVNEFSAGIAKDIPSRGDTYIVSRAEAPWGRNPFSDRRLYASRMMAKEPAIRAAGEPPISFTYTGHITGHMDGETKKIAIINGAEYGVGDSLDIPGYSVKEILPSRVVIVNNKEKRTLQVKLQD